MIQACPLYDDAVPFLEQLRQRGIKIALVYLRALGALGVAAADAVMIDDSASCCAGAAAVGIRAIQIARGYQDGRSAEPAFPIVRSLHGAARVL